MENASKALIIAGAILIAIILIGLGVSIISGMQGAIDSGTETADTYAVQNFNSQFTVYEGENMRATQARQLISTINTSNGQNGFSTPPSAAEIDKTDKYVYLDSSNNGITSSSSIDSSETYTITIEGYSPSGYINKIKIVEN